MLAFDRFKTRIHACKFALDVKNNFQLEATMYMTEEESRKGDEYPFKLDPIIVLVERPELSSRLSIEKSIRKLAKSCGGSFAGT